MRRFLLTTLLAVGIVAALLPSAASAASTQWAAAAEACGGRDPERGSGQMDAAGQLYMACSQITPAGGGAGYTHFNHVGVFDQAGRKTCVVPLDFTGAGGTQRAADVAPSPDGAYLYVIQYDTRTAFRMARTGACAYTMQSQAQWRLANFPGLGGGGSFQPRGQFLATDGAGDIYFSSGLWTVGGDATEDALVKYNAAGALVTRFARKSGGSWALGDSHGSFGGIVVTANGARVFAADINNSRVQRFDRQGDGTYRAVLAMGMNAQNDPNRWGGCFGDGFLAAPYDLTMSPRGELYVMSTTCFGSVTDNGVVKWADKPYGLVEVQRFGQDGAVRGSVVIQSRAAKRVHGIAIDRAGHLHLPQGGVVAAPPAGWSDAGADANGGGPLGGASAAGGGGTPVGPPAGTPDTVAPALVSAASPATTTTAIATLTLVANDNVGVTQVRVREDGVQGDWRAWSPTLEHTLAERLGAHALVVQVRDAAGNASNEAAFTVTRVAPPAPAAPNRPAAPTQPTKPVDVTPTPAKPGTAKPAAPGGADLPATGDTVKPTVARVSMPVQVFRGRSVRVTVKGADDVRATQVRFSTAKGRWGAWKPAGRTATVLLPTGLGWRGVFVQVRDAAGNRSTPWFQTVFVAGRGAQWWKGTAAADAKAFGARTQHVDLSRFDRQVDTVSCGAGFDTVLAQSDDVVAADCEQVTRVQMPVW